MFFITVMLRKRRARVYLRLQPPHHRHKRECEQPVTPRARILELGRCALCYTNSVADARYGRGRFYFGEQVWRPRTNS
jgi:hypothetical protein